MIKFCLENPSLFIPSLFSKVNLMIIVLLVIIILLFFCKSKSTFTYNFSPGPKIYTFLNLSLQFTDFRTLTVTEPIFQNVYTYTYTPNGSLRFISGNINILQSEICLVMKAKECNSHMDIFFDPNTSPNIIIINGVIKNKKSQIIFKSQ